jgi:N-acetylmuramoyl-L-alanine amidase
MKILAFLLFPLLFLPDISDGQIHFLRLRSSHNPDYLRIVLEGNESVLSKASVYQRGQTVLLSIPDATFSIRAEKIMVPFKKLDQHTVAFYPGDLRGLKVFTLDEPFRLVVDVYLKEKRHSILSQILSSEQDNEIDSSGIRAIVIDPGHGGYDFGIVDDGNSEKHAVLDIARKLSQLLNQGSAESFLTRSSDHIMTLKERANYVNNKDADAFISLHIGNHKNVVIYMPVITENVPDTVRQHLSSRGQEKSLRKSMTLARAMDEAARTEFGDDMVMMKSLPYSMLSKIEAAALLVELPSFGSHKYDEKFKVKMANTLRKGFYIYEEIKAK